MEKIPGLKDLEVDPDSETGKEYKIQLNQEVLPRLGLDVQSAGTALRTALEGHLITELTDKGESFYIRIRQDDRELNSLQDLKQIKIREPFGRLVPLSRIAQIVEKTSRAGQKKI